MKRDFAGEAGVYPDANSELLSEDEADELLSGLRDAGHEVLEVGDCRQLVNHIAKWRRQCDLVFNRSVGYVGIERKLFAPAVLEAAEIPYIGSTPYVQMLTRQKFHAKLILEAAGLPTPASALITADGHSQLSVLSYPAIVKPVAESSSIGIEEAESVVESPEAALARGRLLIERYHQPAIVETFVPGLEVEVPLVGSPSPSVLGAVAITKNGALVDGNAFLASDGVYLDDYGFAALPPGVDAQRVGAIAVAAARALGIRDYGRIDMRIRPNGEPAIIEVSTQPHLQRHSSFAEAARARGIPYSQMLQLVVQAATTRLKK